MTAPRVAADDEVRRLRSGAQLLHRPWRLPPAALVRHLAGVQAQVLSAAALGLRARGEGFTAPEVDRARVQDRTIVLTWAMRGTLHLISAQDCGWLVPLVIEPQVPNAYRRLQQEGVPAGQAADALQSIQEMLERESPLTRREISERLRARGVRVEGQAIAHLVWLAAAQGIACYGPDRAREQCFVLVRDWIPEPKPMDREAALAELARRYLQAHQPAAPRDLAAWSGLGQGDAKRAWRLIEDSLVEVETTRGTLWSLRTGHDPAPAGLVRLLPAFDEYLLGWRGRDLTVAAEHGSKINRGGGWLHPVLLVDGRAAGTWRTEPAPRALRLRIEPFTELDNAVRDRVLVEARELSNFLGRAVEVLG